MNDFFDPKNIFILQLETINDVLKIKDYIPYFENMENNFLQFANLFNFPISIFVEKDYVDKTYRDTYYFYFSSKHFTVGKNCYRISLFEGLIEIEEFYQKSRHSNLKNAFIGTIVIKPLVNGTWGKTLIDPQKLKSNTFYVRTTEYCFLINGVEFKINAYPFSSQDTETMTFAETSIWTMLEYYGNRYSEYRSVLPSEMFAEINLSSDERALPSRGLNYLQKSNLLKKFGFSPRVYDRQIYKEHTKQLFHYYVESGIPLTISLNRHSTVCIGHGQSNVDITSVNHDYCYGICCVDSSDLFNSYVIMDDNQYPYVIEEYDKFSLHDDCKQLLRFTVPLYKRIVLEANDAQAIFKEFFKVICSLNLFNEYIRSLGANEDNPVIERIFLTSSRKYKNFRIYNSSNTLESSLYSNLLLPKFVWIMELATYSNYSQKRIFGEFVLDATSSRNSAHNSILLFRIGEYFSYRFPNENLKDFMQGLTSKYAIETTAIQYINNLNFGGHNVENNQFAKFSEN